METIKPQELRIGNYYIDDRIDHLFVVKEIRSNCIEHGDSDYSPTSYRNIKGIEITPDWLSKFGFEYDGGSGYKAPHNTEHWYFTLRNGFMPNSIARGSIKADNYIGCKYIHQLQNLYFALTGQELTQI